MADSPDPEEQLDNESIQDGLDEIAGADDETVETLTVVQATNSDRVDIMFGEYETRQPLTQPEMGNGQAYLVKRLYDPIRTIRFDEPKTEDDVIDWLDSHPDNDALEELDWDDWDRRPLMRIAADTRSTFRTTLTQLDKQLTQVPAETEDAQRAIAQIRSYVNDVLGQIAAAEVDLVESPELAGDGDE